MRLIVVSVMDRAVGVYGQPFVVAALGQAVRSFSDQVNSGGDNPLFKHPQDFDLYQLGFYEDTTGRFELCEPTPELVVRGSSVVKGERNG